MSTVGTVPKRGQKSDYLKGQPVSEKALKAFQAMRHDVEQFDDHEPQGDSGLFSDKVPLFMKSYLVNWMRKFMQEHGDETERVLGLPKTEDN